MNLYYIYTTYYIYMYCNCMYIYDDIDLANNSAKERM